MWKDFEEEEEEEQEEKQEEWVAQLLLIDLDLYSVYLFSLRPPPFKKQSKNIQTGNRAHIF